jgi:hypothetical protein
LLAFTTAVDFEIFRAEVTRALSYSDGSRGGRPPFDPVLMFKVLVIQASNTLSDERTESLINDRLSFMRFLGLSLSDRVPDARTIWLFREKLTRAGAIKPLFERFDAALREAGYIAMGELSGILCAGPVAPSRLNEPFVEHGSELGLCLEPLARRHFPLSSGLAQDEKQELRRGVIGGKMTSCAHGAA